VAVRGDRASVTRPRWPAALVLAAFPAAIGAAHAWTARQVSPLWMGGSTDPTYPYVLNALLVAEGRPPALATHPGTPLQVLGAAALHVAHAVSGSPQGLREHVLTDPEGFVGAIRGTLLSLFVLANLLLGWAAYRLTRSLSCAAAVQAAPLASFLGSRMQLTVMCEPLLLVLGLVLSAWVLLVLGRGPEARGVLEPLAAGVVVGLGIATKLLFAPVALLPLFVLRTGRQRAAYLAWTLLAFALGVAPLWPRLGPAAAWVASSVLHTGLDTGGYGKGPGGVLDPRLLWSVLLQFLRGEIVVYAVAAAALATAVALSARTPPSGLPVRRALLAAVGVQLLVLLQSAKSMGPHHLMSAVSLTGLVVALTYRLAVVAGGPGRSRLPSAVAGLFLFLLVGRHAYLVRSYLAERAPVHAGALAAAATAGRLGGDRVVQGYCVSTIESNLAMANDWSWRAFTADLQRIYPHAVFFDWAGLHRFGRPVTAREMEARLVDGDALLLWDTFLYPHETFGLFRGLPTTEIGRWGRDRLVRGSLAPLRANAVSEAAAPPFGGVLILGPSVGLDRPAPPHALGDFVPLGPVTRLGVLGNGEPLRLVAESRCEEGAGQVQSFAIDGSLVGRQALAGDGWQRTEVDLPPRQGLFELDIGYDRLWTSEDAARPMYPGYGDPRPEVRWPAVRYRKLQVWLAGEGESR
jgi:hypothetical protein